MFSAPLGRSLLLALVAALTALVLGAAWAALTRVRRAPGGRALLLLELAPLLVPPYVAAVAWLAALGPAGWLARALARDDGLPAQVGRGWVDSPLSAGLLLGGCWFPLVSLAVGAGLRRLDPTQLEAARLCAGARGEWALRLAAARAPALAGALGVLALALVELAVPQLLRVGVQAEEVLRLQAEAQLGAALLAGLPLQLLAAAAVAAALLLAPRPPERAGEAALDPAPRAPAGLLSLAPLGVVLGPGLLLPLAWLVVRLAAPPTGGDPLGLLRDAWRDVGPDARRSALLGAGAATLGVVLALLAAWPLRRAPRRAALLLALPAAALTACPGPLLGILLLQGLYLSPWLDPLLSGLWAPGLGCLLRFGPLAAALLLPACARVPREQEEVAALAGRGPLARLVGVGVPSLAPALLAAWLLVYALSVGEYAAGVVLSAPGASLLAVCVVNEAHYGQGDVLAGQCALLLAVGLLPLPLFALGMLLRRAARR